MADLATEVLSYDEFKKRLTHYVLKLLYQDFNLRNHRSHLLRPRIG
jgi:hypothetical protein